MSKAEHNYHMPNSHFVVEQGSGMYYEIDVDYWASMLYLDLEKILRGRTVSEELYPTLFWFIKENNSNFAKNYDKHIKKQKNKENGENR